MAKEEDQCVCLYDSDTSNNPLEVYFSEELVRELRQNSVASPPKRNPDDYIVEISGVESY